MSNLEFHEHFQQEATGFPRQVNSSCYSYQQFDVQTRQEGLFCVVLTGSSRLCVFLNK